jgi:hypothetical protein
MKCVPIKPFVLAPQMKNDPASNQNTPDRDARRNPPKAIASTLRAAGAATTASGGAP